MATAEIRFGIDGMSCAGCVSRAEKAIAAVSGVAAAYVNLADGSAKVTVRDAAAGRAVAGALQAAGYPALPARMKLAVSGLSCGSCVGRAEAALNAVPGVLAASVNLADQSAMVTTLCDVAPLQDAMATAGYPVTPAADQAPAENRQMAEVAAYRRNFGLAALLTLPVFVLEMGSHMFPAMHHWIADTIGMRGSWLVQFVLTTWVLAGPGRGFFTKGLPALRRFAPDMNSLVVLGTTAAWVFSTMALFAPDILPDGTRAVYFEAAAVIVTLILLGRWLEARAKGQTGAAIRRLIGLRPDTAVVLRDGATVTVPLAQVALGDVVVIRPGARIPVDGIVREGRSFIDESMITGEPVAVEKTKGATLTGGTINGTGALQMRATAVGADTMLARIIAMVADAQSARLPVQDLVNRITAWFVPAVLAIATLTVITWLVFGPEPVLSYALVAGVSVLIIACPCAMGLATPMSIMVGSGRAADMGVLFRQGDALQALQGVEVVAFDKTGTLTLGKPVVTDAVALDGDHDGLLRQAAAVEALSEHPLSRAIVAAASGGLPAVSGFEAVTGHGVKADVGGVPVLVGAARLLQREGVDHAPLTDIAADLAAAGKTAMMVAIGGQPAGVIAVADTLRPSAKATVQALLDRGLRVVMITGDGARTAAAIAADLRLGDVIADVLPAGKLDAIGALQQDGSRVAFVGDGINDAPALAAADVGIAIGTGTDVAVESADVVLMSGDPVGVLNGIAISRATMANIRQNLGWAFGYNVLLVPVAAGVLFPAWGVLLSPALAAGAMALSSVLVVTNALRLRWIKGQAG